MLHSFHREGVRKSLIEAAAGCDDGCAGVSGDRHAWDERFVGAVPGCESLGDCEPVGEGIHEMRVHVGPGYRLYFTRRGHRVIFLLLGGDKATQSRDIKRAKTMAKELDEG